MPNSLRLLALLLTLFFPSMLGSARAERAARVGPFRTPLPSPAAGQAQGAMPAAAQAIVDKLEKERQRIYREAEAKLAPYRQRAAKKLKALQDRYTRAAKLDEALAVRSKVREVLGIRPDPGGLRATPGDIGRSFLYEVVGSAQGAIWGSGVYTTDSHLATAAVHAGVLKVGERGIVRVWVRPGQPSYQGSTANGVTSYGYGSWSLSFTVERK
jgi:hypothetical protein